MEQSEHSSDGRKPSKRCQYPGCDTWPSFNYEGKLSGAYCATHKLKGMVINRKKRCAHPDCTKRPSFNKPGQAGVRYCAAHKEQGMVDVHKAACAHPGCITWPSFRDPANPRKRYCNKHKADGMICRQGCAHPGCTRWPAFHHPGDRKRQFCSEHKEDGMIDTKHRRCGLDGCVKKPSFNFPGQPALRCKDHIEEGMVNVLSKQCAANLCQKRPNFNLPGEREALFCAVHAGQGMVNLSKKVNTGFQAAELRQTPLPYAAAPATHSGPTAEQLAAVLQLAATAAGVATASGGMVASEHRPLLGAGHGSMAAAEHGHMGGAGPSSLAGPGYVSHADGGQVLAPWEPLSHDPMQLSLRQHSNGMAGPSGLAHSPLPYLPTPCSDAMGMQMSASGLMHPDMHSGAHDMQFVSLAAAGADENQYQSSSQAQLGFPDAGALPGLASSTAAQGHSQQDQQSRTLQHQHYEPQSVGQSYAGDVDPLRRPYTSDAQTDAGTSVQQLPPVLDTQEAQTVVPAQQGAVQLPTPLVVVYEVREPAAPAREQQQYLHLPLRGMRAVPPPARPVSLMGMY